MLCHWREMDVFSAESAHKNALQPKTKRPAGRVVTTTLRFFFILSTLPLPVCHTSTSAKLCPVPIFAQNRKPAQSSQLSCSANFLKWIPPLPITYRPTPACLPLHSIEPGIAGRTRPAIPSISAEPFFPTYQFPPRESPSRTNTKLPGM